MTPATWDGLPVSDTDPRGASVIVYREGKAGLEVLVLHRAHRGPDFEGDWAWTPPSGARQPGENIDIVAVLVSPDARKMLALSDSLFASPWRLPKGHLRSVCQASILGKHQALGAVHEGCVVSVASV